MRAVNLLPKDAGRQRRLVTQQNAPFFVAGGAGIVVVVALVFLYSSASTKVTNARHELQDARAELAALPAPPPEQTPTDSALAAEQGARVTAVSTAIGGRVAWDRILREFSLVLPDDVWLTTMSLKSPAAAGQTGSGTSPTDQTANFSITGYTYSHESVARLLTRLSLIPELTSVALTSSARQGTSGRTVLFTVTANLVPIGAAPAASGTTSIPTASASGASS